MIIEARHEIWPLREAFNISRGSKTEANVVVATVSMGSLSGRGECAPYPRYGESIDQTLAEIADLQAKLESADAPLGRKRLVTLLPPGAARNAVDCALWDLAAKQSGRSALESVRSEHPAPSAHQRPLQPRETCLTISMAEPDAMADKALKHAPHKLLKLKLGGSDWSRDGERMGAVRAARPEARLIVDANEGWPAEALPDLLGVARHHRVELVEQPVPAGQDRVLRSIPHAVPVCADESLGPGSDLSSIADVYDAVNIKLDKAGGLTTAIELLLAAKQAGLRVMVGSMVATSLSMAPARVLAELGADWIDLDSPGLLALDRPNALHIDSAGFLSPPTSALWG